MPVSVSVMTRYRRWVGSMRTIVASTTGAASYVGKDHYLHESFRQLTKQCAREKTAGLRRVHSLSEVLSAEPLIPSTILLVPWDTTARSAATQNLRNLRMTKRDVLLLKFVPRAERSLVPRCQQIARRAKEALELPQLGQLANQLGSDID
jgi:hypothetical protein